MSENTGAAESAEVSAVDSSEGSDEGMEQGSEQVSGQQASGGAPVAGGAVGAAIGKIQEKLENGEITKTQAQNLVKKVMIRVDGRDIERSINVNDEKELRNLAQLAEVSKRRMQETSELKKLYQGEIERLRSDPFAVLKELGLDPDDLSENYLRSRIEEFKKTPEQLEKEKYMKELELARKEADALKKEKEEMAYERTKQQFGAKFENDLMRVLDSHTSLPQSPMVVKKIADTMLWAMDQGYHDVEIEDILPIIENELQSDISRFIEELPEQAFEKYVSKKAMDKARKKRIATALPVNNPAKAAPTSNKASELSAKKEAPKARAKDFFRSLK